MIVDAWFSGGPLAGKRIAVLDVPEHLVPWHGRTLVYRRYAQGWYRLSERGPRYP